MMSVFFVSVITFWSSKNAWILYFSIFSGRDINIVGSYDGQN